MFSTHHKANFSFWAIHILSSANIFDLVKSTILSFGKELTQFFTQHGPDAGWNMYISMGESNTVISAYTMYMHLQQYCSHPLIWIKVSFEVFLLPPFVSSKQANAFLITSSGSVPFSFSPNMVKNIVKLMGPGAQFIISSKYWSVGFLPENHWMNIEWISNVHLTRWISNFYHWCNVFS